MLAALLMKAGYQCALRMGATHIVLDTYVGNCRSTERLYVKLGFDQLTEPYDDPDYLWRQGVVTFGLDCEAARRHWPAQRPGLYRLLHGRRRVHRSRASPGMEHRSSRSRARRD